jgi:hypothetical protein
MSRIASTPKPNGRICLQPPVRAPSWAACALETGLSIPEACALRFRNPKHLLLCSASAALRDGITGTGFGVFVDGWICLPAE